MNDGKTIKQQAKLRFKEILGAVSEVYPHLKRSNKIRDIKLIFSDTIDDAIAQAHHPSWTVELSMSALFKNKEYILAEVIGHEICHLLTMILYNGRGWGHYPLWKRTMVEMGFEPIK